MSWDESAGRVSRSFNDWYLIDRDERAFLRLGLRFASESYNRTWEEIGQEPAGPDDAAQPDVFNDRIEGLWPHDYEWMHAAAVIRDAVTNYEVYLEKAREEILRRHGHPNVIGDQAPTWGKVKSFFTKLGLDLESTEVKNVRDLRHFLVHRRGELRTERERQTFVQEKPDELPPLEVELSEEDVVNSLEILGDAVRCVDRVVYEYSWGRKRLEQLLTDVSRDV